MLAKAVKDLIASDDALEALLGCGIHPLTYPSGAKMPVLTYQLVGGVGQPTFDTSGMQRRRYQFDALSDSYAQADLIRAMLMKFLSGYRGRLSDGTFLQNVYYIQSIDFFDSNPRQFRCVVEFYFYYTFSS
jgi:hypothetical protein